MVIFFIKAFYSDSGISTQTILQTSDCLIRTNVRQPIIFIYQDIIFFISIRSLND